MGKPIRFEGEDFKMSRTAGRRDGMQEITVNEQVKVCACSWVGRLTGWKKAFLQ